PGGGPPAEESRPPPGPCAPPDYTAPALPAGGKPGVRRPRVPRGLPAERHYPVALLLGRVWACDQPRTADAAAAAVPRPDAVHPDRADDDTVRLRLEQAVRPGRVLHRGHGLGPD